MLSGEVATSRAKRKSRRIRATTSRTDPDSVGQLLLRHARHEVASRALLSGCEIQQVRCDPLPHRAEGVDRRLLQRLIQPSVQLLRQRPRDPGIAVRRRGQRR